MLIALWLALAADPQVVAIEVVDAKGAPIEGAQVGLAPEGPRDPGTQCGDDLGEGTSVPRVSAVTGRDGRVAFDVRQIASVCPPPPRCPPGAPCAQPMACSPRLSIQAGGFLPLSLRRGWQNGLRVTLVASGAKVVTRAAALAAVKAHPRWHAWVDSHQYRAPLVCLERDGTWRVAAASVSWPIYLPPQTAKVHPESGAVSLISCPVQGSHLLVEHGVGESARLIDDATGLVYSCAQEASCRALLIPGQRLVVGSYGAPVDGCGQVPTADLNFEVGTTDASIPKVACRLERCRRIE